MAVNAVADDAEEDVAAVAEVEVVVAHCFDHLLMALVEVAVVEVPFQENLS